MGKKGMILGTGKSWHAGLKTQDSRPKTEDARPEIELSLGSALSLESRVLSLRAFSLGMTLMEILVVLGVIGIIVGMSVPALTRYAGQMRLKAVTRQVVGLVSLARSLSIGSQAGHAIVVDAGTRRITVVNSASGEALEQVVRLPSGISAEVQVGGVLASEQQVVFRTSGALTGRATSIVLSDGKKRSTITVTGATGAINVQ